MNIAETRNIEIELVRFGNHALKGMQDDYKKTSETLKSLNDFLDQKPGLISFIMADKNRNHFEKLITMVEKGNINPLTLTGIIAGLMKNAK
jgi:hypothetical protein